MSVAVVAPKDTLVTKAVAEQLRPAGWTVHADTAIDTAITALVYDPGLLDVIAPIHAGDVVDAFLDTVERIRPRLRTPADGGARIVVVSSRDGLGQPDRVQPAAAAGALVSAARSLALSLALDGVTVNVVAALPPESSTVRAAQAPNGLRDPGPAELTPAPVTADDIADAVRFFLDPRSGYITGQVLYCCGGASLLSSLSV